jgi:PD-(D/E)XK nuclease superfamily
MPIIEPPLGTGYGHRSVSQLSSFAQCGEAYRLSRVAKAPARPAAWFYHGTAYHFAVEEWENSGRKLSNSVLESLFSDLYQEEVAKAKERWPDEKDWLTGGNKKGNKDIEDREAIGVWQVHDYVEFANAHKDVWRILPLGDGKIATEVQFSITLGGVLVNGFIDQIRQYKDGSLEPADLKTGSREPGSTLQLGAYARAIEQNTGVLPTTGVFVKAGRPATAKVAEKPTKDIKWNVDQWTPELMGSMFKDMDRADKLGLFLPNPQDGCERTCTVAENCRIKGWGEGKATFADIKVRAA